MKSTIIYIILLNRVMSQIVINSVNQINASRDSTESNFSLPQTVTSSETTLAVSTGNNLNVTPPDIPDETLEARRENFRAISPIYPVEKTNSDEKSDEETFKLLSSREGNSSESEVNEKANDINNTSASQLVWDNCYETSYRDNHQVNAKVHYDMENAHRLEIDNGGMLKNREFLENNGSLAVRNWLEKYNNLKNSIAARKSTTEMTTEISSIASKDYFDEAPMDIGMMKVNSVQILPITKEIVRDYEFSEPYNVTVDVLVTENNIKASYNDDWFEGEDRTKIKFSSMPQTQTYLIPKFKLEEGFHPFSFMSQFFSMIYPFDFPVGLIKDIVWGKFTFPYSFLQSIKMESTFLAFIIAFACFALVIPIYLLILGVLALLSGSNHDDELETGALFPDAEPDCNDKSVVIVTFLVVLLCGSLISGMVLSNEQSRMAAEDSRNVVSCACTDIAAWLSAAARELHQGLVPPIDMVLYAYKNDLKNVDTLLGDPIQQSIASESGIDFVLDSLMDIVIESKELSSKITSLRNYTMKARSLASVASDRIQELRRQIDNLKKLCNTKDAPLCDTINTNTLKLQMQFDSILHEPQLLDLRALGVENLTQAISQARQEFQTLPSAILVQTESVRDDVIRDIEVRRQMVHNSARVLKNIVRHLTSGLRSLAHKLEGGLERLEKYDYWRWILMLACTVAFACVMLLIFFALLCGCGNAKIHAKRTLQVSSLWLCLVSLILWCVISATFLIAGHAEVFICHALWDSPQYSTLSSLLDRPSPLLQHNEGIFDVLLRELENVTIEVSVRDVLRDCEKNRPAYVVFQLDKMLDVNKETSYFEWEELQADLDRLSSAIDVGFLKTISFNFNRLLHDILDISDVNMTKYRLEYDGPVVGKDLPSLIDQLENVAAQVTDLSTAGRLETLASRTQKLHSANIKPLEQLRANLVFRLTELELQLIPFRRKLNISLSHIHTAQFYINNQGHIIAQKKVSTFVSRLVSHTAGWRTHVLTSAGKHAGKCRPLFTVYSAIRSLLCTKYVASLHGWWFCGVLLGIFWFTTLTPLCVKLWRSFGKKIRALETLNLTSLSQQGTPATAVCDDNNWSAPPGPPPPRNDSW
ncbi:prominin-1-A isoform X2 [Pieris napi]|uniref:prominin-1-A isoform X2 n=1 Tax=Pieris napi TaxID=78633 RepID=UPI001FB8AD54|nr:prominin-1-A isoform X2 [Pieris napi]